MQFVTDSMIEIFFNLEHTRGNPKGARGASDQKTTHWLFQYLTAECEQRHPRTRGEFRTVKMKQIIQQTFLTLRLTLSTTILFALIAVIVLAEHGNSIPDIWTHIVVAQVILLIFPEVCECRSCRNDPNEINIRFGPIRILH